MGMTPAGNDGDLNFEINVTPLVDVVLVLLIIFMVVVPLTLRGYEVDVPSKVEAVATEPPPPQPDAVVLSIAARDCALTTPLGERELPPRCRVSLGDVSFPVTDLPSRLAAVFVDRPAPEDRTLFLDAEDTLNYEGVMRILDLAHGSVEGLRVGLWTDVMEMAAAR